MNAPVVAHLWSPSPRTSAS